jgi:hypothetical protein
MAHQSHMKRTTRIIVPSFATWTMAIAFSLVPPGAASVTLQQGAFSDAALNARMPAVREESYVVNARVRPMLLFWISRDNIGEARITWRKGPADGRAFELLIGSDPLRAPRRINRWGFIVEELHGANAEILGVMKESNEQTIAEADAETARRDGIEVSTFKAARTTIIGNQAVSGTMTVRAPAELTYRDLDALLGLIPREPPRVRTLTLPPGTQKGFLVALDSLIHASVGPCESRAGLRQVPGVPYVYNQALYDLSLVSCAYEPAWKTQIGASIPAVDGRFQLTNRITKSATKFRLVIGTSGEWRGVPVRMVFRPRWWMEVELTAARSAGVPPEAAAVNRTTRSER